MNPELERLYEATDNLVNQQFYMGDNDTIIGRTPEVSLKIAKSGQIIQKFKDLFNLNLKFFFAGDYLKFLLVFQQIKGISEQIVMDLDEQVRNKLQYLEGMEIDIAVLYTIILSAIITQIRDFHFNMAIDEVKTRSMVRSKNELDDDEIQSRLNQLFMRNNDNVSILYNISYLDALAESFNFRKVAKVCKIQKSKYINRIVKIILENSADNP